MVDLGKLKKVVIGHSKKGRGKGWFCEEVRVRRGGEEEATTETLFPCGHWLDTGCEDRKLERELVPIAEIPIVAEEDQQEDGPQSGEEEYKRFIFMAE